MPTQILYSISPKPYKRWLERHMVYCDLGISPVKMVGFFFTFSVLIAAALGVVSNVFLGASLEMMLAVSVAGFFVTAAMMHMMLIMIADSRAGFVETILPDALEIISANMRSGLTPDKAILTSARPEFGPLEAELKRVSKETLSGRPFEESLKGMTRKIKSNVLSKTVDLIVEGLAKGGSLTTLLDSIAEDVRQARLLRGEIKSYVMMYGIFIFFAAAIGAPLLYSVSTYMVQTLNTLGAQVGDIGSLASSSSSVSFLKYKASGISSEFLFQYSAVAILVTSIFGSLLIGLVSDGTEKAGLKYIPVLAGMGFAVFYGSQFVLKEVLSAFG